MVEEAEDDAWEGGKLSWQVRYILNIATTKSYLILVTLGSQKYIKPLGGGRSALPLKIILKWWKTQNFAMIFAHIKKGIVKAE